MANHDAILRTQLNEAKVCGGEGALIVPKSPEPCPRRPCHDAIACGRWLNGTFDDAVAFQERCYADELIEIVRTQDLWVKRKMVQDGEPVLI